MTTNTVEKFWKKVNKTEGCWEWTGKLDEGYGKFSLQRRVMRTHRFSWELHNGPIPVGIKVCHQCDNRSCVRPDHLFLGTDQDNLGDATSKGRMKKKLFPHEVVEIMKLVSSGVPAQEIADRFKISRHGIQSIKYGLAWSHLTGIKRKQTRWSRKYDKCQRCETARRPHAAHGLCDCCYVSDVEKRKRKEKAAMK